MNISLHDPRPDDPAELAAQVAKELRKRGLWAAPDSRLRKVVRVLISVEAAKRESDIATCYHVEMQTFSGLGPIAIADVIQAEEAKRAQEWAGDKKEEPCSS